MSMMQYYVFYVQVAYILHRPVFCIIYLLTDATAVANFSNEECATGGVKPSEPLLFTCEIYGVVLLRVVVSAGDQEIISVGDTATDVALPRLYCSIFRN